MSQRYYELRYRQIRILLVAAVVGLLASGVMWLSGTVKNVADPWVKWPFRVAALSFLFAVSDFAFPALDFKMMIKKRQYPPLLPDQRRLGDREIFAGVVGLAIGLVALLLVIYRLSAAD